MRILGIDPGFATVGYGIVNYDGNKFSACDYGVITTLARTPFEDRLEQLYDELTKIIEFYNPETVAFEELFFNTNLFISFPNPYNDVKPIAFISD